MTAGLEQEADLRGAVFVEKVEGKILLPYPEIIPGAPGGGNRSVQVWDVARKEAVQSVSVPPYVRGLAWFGPHPHWKAGQQSREFGNPRVCWLGRGLQQERRH